jgi:hypothetical protein
MIAQGGVIRQGAMEPGQAIVIIGEEWEWNKTYGSQQA